MTVGITIKKFKPLIYYFFFTSISVNYIVVIGKQPYKLFRNYNKITYENKFTNFETIL